jgi:hypothetical protein
VRPQPKPPVPLYDSDNDPAPAPCRKLGSRKRTVPDEDESEDKYSKDDNAKAEETTVAPSPRLTRANAKGHKPAATPKPIASKPAPKTTKPVRQVFDGIELETPPRKKTKSVPAAPTAFVAAPTAPAAAPPAEGFSGESRQRNPHVKTSPGLTWLWRDRG